MGSNSDLLTLAAKASKLAATACRENETYCIARKLSRDPHNIEALFEWIVYEARTRGGALTEYTKTPQGFALLQFAMHQVSYLRWEDLWNEAHPERFGQAWEGQDVALMWAWRKKVRTMISECHQGPILAMRADEYIAKLTEAAVGEKEAKELADWLSDVVYEEPTDSA